MNQREHAATARPRGLLGLRSGWRRDRLPSKLVRVGLAAVAMVAASGAAPRAEFTNRYPKLSGFNHQIYVEGYELPILNPGLADPAVSPDGRRLVVAVSGHLWLIPLTGSGTAAGPAQRLTGGRALDSRPAWAPDGQTLAAVRDTGTDTHIVRIDVARALAAYATVPAAAPAGAAGAAVPPAPASSAHAAAPQAPASSAHAAIPQAPASSPGTAIPPAAPASSAPLASRGGAAGGSDAAAAALGPAETVAVDTPALELDPSFSADGRFLYYSSAVAGDLDLWRLELATSKQERLTKDRGLELRPLPLPDGRHVVFLTKQRSGADTVSLLELSDGSQQVLLRESIGSLLRPALSADGRRLALNLPDPAASKDAWRLWVYDLQLPATAGQAGRPAQLGPPVAVGALPLATASRGEPLRPLTPTFSGDAVLFAAADGEHRFHLYRAPLDGRPPTELAPPRFADEPHATLIVRTVRAGASPPVAARLHLERADGHPLLPPAGIVRLDSQSGLTYVYSDGVLKLAVPPGVVRVVAARGLTAPAVQAEATLKAGEERQLTLTLSPVWDAAAAGYVSGDHHFHLNYGGPYTVGQRELQQVLRAEELDVATPMVANLHNRLQDLWLWPAAGSPSRPASTPASAPLLGSGRPLIALSQEVRSHFLGHLGVVGVPTPFWPWYWGPGYPVYGSDDRPNAEVLQDTRQRGGLGSYVHPVASRDPFARTAETAPGAAIPLMLIADAVLGDLDALEVACLWSDELGTSAVWQRLLNLGLPVALSAGTDAMVNVHRNMAVGTARIYVRHPGPLSLRSYLEAVRAGRSFVTTGPFLELVVAGKRPGEVVPDPGPAAAAGRAVDFSLTVAAAMPLSRVEVLVNGAVAFRSPADAPVLARPGRTQLRGRLQLPAGGHVVARAVGESMQWPGMDSYPFALTGPVWLGKVGSVDRAAQQAAAAELLLALESAEARLRAAFTPEQAPRLHQRLAAARARLTALRQPD